MEMALPKRLLIDASGPSTMFPPVDKEVLVPVQKITVPVSLQAAWGLARRQPGEGRAAEAGAENDRRGARERRGRRPAHRRSVARDLARDLGQPPAAKQKIPDCRARTRQHAARRAPCAHSSGDLLIGLFQGSLPHECTCVYGGIRQAIASLHQPERICKPFRRPAISAARACLARPNPLRARRVRTRRRGPARPVRAGAAAAARSPCARTSRRPPPTPRRRRFCAPRHARRRNRRWPSAAPAV